MQAIKALFEDEEVQAAIKDSRFYANVYLIDSIQVAHGAEYWMGNTREIGGDVGVSMDLTCTGAPVTVGVGVNGHKTFTTSSSGRITTDFVFAYSLREITYRRKMVRRQRRMSGGDLVRYRAHWSDKEDVLGLEDSVAEVLLLKEDDPELPGCWDWEGQDATDLDGSICQVVAVGTADSDEY